MVALTDVVRRITVRASAEGVDATAAAMQKLAGGERAVAVASEQVGRATTSMEAKLATIQRRLDSGYRQAQDMARLERELATARSQGLITLERQNELLALQAERYKQAAGGARGLFSAMGGGKALLGGLGIGLGIGELMKLPGEIADVVSNVAHLGDVADTIGITTRQLQELQFAAKQVDVGTEDMTTALEKFSKNLGEAAQGGGKLHDILEANHVTVSGDLMKDFQAYAELIDHARNAQEKNVLVTTAFGKSAAELGNLFQGGAAGVQAYVEQADRLGAVIDDEKVAQIRKIDDQFSALATTLGVKFREAVVGAVLAMDGMVQRNNDLSNSVTALYQNPNWDNFVKFMFGSGGGGAPGFHWLDKTGPVPGSLIPGTAAPPLPPPIEIASRPTASSVGVTRLPHVASDAEKDAARLQKQFDDALKAADKQTAALKAQADSFDMTAGAAAEFQKRQELVNLATENHIRLSPAEIDHIDAIAKAYGDATDALDKMKDAQQAQQFLAQSFYDAAKGADSFSDAASRLASTLADALAQAALLGQGPLAGILGTSSQSGGILGSLIGGVLGVGGGGVNGGLYHSGGIVGETAVPARYVHPSYFDDAPRFHSGLMPDEFPAILQRGETVIPRGGSSGGSVTINQNITVQGSSGDASADARYIAALRREMKAAAREVIKEEMRPRGTFDPF